MKVILDSLDTPLSEKVRIIRNLMKRENAEEFPEEYKWAVQALYKEDSWTEICRIDNYLHDDQTGSHIHIKGRVKRLDLGFPEAVDMIKKITKKIAKEVYGEEL